MDYSYLQSAVAPGLMVDIKAAGGVRPGSSLQVYSEKDAANQWWIRRDVSGTGYFRIVSGEPGLVMGIDTAGSIHSGSSLKAVSQQNDNRQFWTSKTVQGKPGFLLVSVADPSLVIDAGGAQSGSQLRVVTEANDARQFWTWVPAAVAPTPTPLSGSVQYVFSSQAPIQNLAVEIAISEAIVVSSYSSLSPTSPPRPIGFQINGLSPAKHQTQGDKNVAWVQYGVKMWPGTTNLISFAEYWPQSLVTNRNAANTFNLSGPNPITLPNDLTIPAGWKIKFTFQHLSDGTTTGFDCVVTDTATGAQVLPDLGINFLADQPLAAKDAGNITQADLPRVIAFQVVLVGFWASSQSVLDSGYGTITCTAQQPLTAGNVWPQDASGAAEGLGGTNENSNSTYSLLPAAASRSIAQTFEVAPVPVPRLEWTKLGNTQGGDGWPNFGDTSGDPTLIGDFTGAGKQQVLFYSPGEGNWWRGTDVHGAFQWVLAGNTQGGDGGPNFGNTAGDPIWSGDFEGVGKDQVLLYSPGDGNWFLGTDSGGKFEWAPAGNTEGGSGGPNYGNTAGDPTWIGDFSGTGRQQVLFYSPGDGSWFLGSVLNGTFQWEPLGNTQGGNRGPNFGNTAGDPTWIGDFGGVHKQQVLFYSPGDGNWFLGTVVNGAFQWVRLGNTQRGAHNFGNTAGDPTWIGDFTGADKQELLFNSPGDGNWWLARDKNGAFGWKQENPPETLVLGNPPAGWGRVGDFAGTGRQQVLFYSSGDGNWWLLGYVDGIFQWSLLGNTQGGAHNFGNTVGDPTWVGDFSGAPKQDQLLFYSPGDGNWWLGSYAI
jgi:hypothetical protein